jgi:hypothetical protein
MVISVIPLNSSIVYSKSAISSSFEMLFLKFWAKRERAVVKRFARPPPVVRVDLLSLDILVFNFLALLRVESCLGRRYPTIPLVLSLEFYLKELS